MASRTKYKCKAKKSAKKSELKAEQHQHEKPGDDIRWTKQFYDPAPSHRYHFLSQLKSDFKPFSFYCVRFLHVETLTHSLPPPLLRNFTLGSFLCSSKKVSFSLLFPACDFYRAHTHTHTTQAHNSVTLSNFLLKMAPRGTIS